MAKSAKTGEIVKVELAIKNHASPLDRAVAAVAKTLRSDPDYEQAAKVRIAIASARKAIDAEITAIIKPIRAGLDKLYEKRKNAFASLDALSAPLAQRMRAYDDAKRVKEVAKAKKLAAKAPTREQAKDIKVSAATRPMAPKVAGITVKKVWTFEVIDLAKVPAYHDGVEIREIKKAPILRLIRATEGKVKIPGIKAKLETSDSVRG